jgi:hypothetical protein
MKTLSLTCLAGMLLSVQVLFAQTLLVEQRTVQNEESDDLLSWTARVDQDVDFCMDTYGDFIKELTKTKVDKRGKNVLVAEKTVIPEIMSIRMDQRAIFTPESGGTAVSFTFSPGYDIHLGKEHYKAEFEKGETFVKNYVRYHYEKFYRDQISDLKDKIKSRQNDIESNGKKLDKNNKTIAENKADGETEKTRTKNEKMLRENDGYTVDTAKKRREIEDLENQLANANEALQKALAYR